MRRVGWLVGLLVGLLVIAPVSAQEPTPERRPSADDVNRVAAQLYCPVCENEPLDVCQTAACVQWKAQIAQYLAEGKNDDEIIQIFVDRFGPNVKAHVLPETPILWIGPLVVAILGGAFALIVIRRMIRRGRATQPAPPARSAPGGDEYADRVERDLKQNL
ncbi:MAG TPA: cytochrome c-type biogenesis protein CcmH [Anaerolineae bacterium]|nr:cytochrome c-type biogenesis protein CcmH [Anaerolineae bacterium]